MSVLIADIGGTNARFSLLAEDGAVEAAVVLPTADFSGPAAAIQHFLSGQTTRPHRAALAVACPVLPGEDRVRLTNAPWDFSIAATRQKLGLDSLQVVNDFVAAALAIPSLRETDTLILGGKTAHPHTPILALGPGTGLGVALLLPQDDGTWRPLPTEGGHVTLCATTNEEDSILAALWPRFGHVSAERLLSGSGLTLLYEYLAAGGPDSVPPTLQPHQITTGAINGTCPLCRRVLDLFFGWLGTVTGNLVLSSGALGGVYLMGGILPRVADALKASEFYTRFKAKGRFQSYLETVPVHLVVHPNPGMLGLRAAVTTA